MAAQSKMTGETPCCPEISGSIANRVPNQSGIGAGVAQLLVDQRSATGRKVGTFVWRLVNSSNFATIVWATIKVKCEFQSMVGRVYMQRTQSASSAWKAGVLCIRRVKRNEGPTVGPTIAPTDRPLVRPLVRPMLGPIPASGPVVFPARVSN